MDKFSEKPAPKSDRAINKLNRSNWFAALTVATLVLVNSLMFNFMSIHQEHRFKLAQAVIQQKNELEVVASKARYFFAEIQNEPADYFLLSEIQQGLIESFKQYKAARSNNVKLTKEAILSDQALSFKYYDEPPYRISAQLERFEALINVLVNTSPENLKQRYRRWNILYLIVSDQSTLMRGTHAYLNELINSSDEYTNLMKKLVLFLNIVILATLAIQLFYIFRPLWRQLEKEHIALETSEQKLQTIATTDPLTQLVNRYGLEQRIKQLISAPKHKNHFSILVIDLDKFKPINDRYGHDVGDIVLAKTAQRMQANLRKNDFSARIGGDEFVICLMEINSHQQLLNMLEKITEVILMPIAIEHLQTSVSITASVGYANFPTHGKSLSQLFKHADIEMYKNKKAKDDETS